MNERKSRNFRIMMLLVTAACWLSCQKKNENPAALPSLKPSSDKPALSKDHEKVTPFVLDIRPDSVIPPSPKIAFHIQEIRAFLNMMTKDHLSLEDYKRHFSIHSEYEEICFFMVCCDPSREPSISDCWEIYKQRYKFREKRVSFFLAMLREKLFLHLHYTNAGDVDVRFVRASYYEEIKFQAPRQKVLSSCTYEVVDKQGGKVYIVVNAVSGEPATLGGIGDETGVSILEFVSKKPCA